MNIVIVPKSKEDELMHYGVLGMKWGVRKGRTSQDYKNEYAKASKKLSKINSKYDNLEQKTMKKQYKLDKKLNSVFASNESKKKAAIELQELRRKNYKAARKGHNWIKRMEKSFSKVDISLSDQDRKIGEKYLEVMRLHALR